MPTRHDLECPIWKGDTFKFTVVFKENGAPFSVESSTLIFTVKEGAHVADADATVYYEYTFPNPDSAGAAGTHTIVLQPSQTQPIPKGCYIYQVMLSTPSLGPEPTVITYLWGKITVGDS